MYFKVLTVYTPSQPMSELNAGFAVKDLPTQLFELWSMDVKKKRRDFMMLLKIQQKTIPYEVLEIPHQVLIP